MFIATDEWSHDRACVWFFCEKGFSLRIIKNVDAIIDRLCSHIYWRHFAKRGPCSRNDKMSV